MLELEERGETDQTTDDDKRTHGKHEYEADFLADVQIKAPKDGKRRQDYQDVVEDGHAGGCEDSGILVYAFYRGDFIFPVCPVTMKWQLMVISCGLLRGWKELTH